MLDNQLKAQTLEYLKLLENDIVFTLSLDDSNHSQELETFIKEICALDDQHLSYTYGKLDFVPAFSIDKANDHKSGIVFAGIPLGHEYNSFILALLQVSGRAPKVDETVIRAIQQIKEPMSFVTYASLTCHNCPEVVQSLNILAVLNDNISHTMVDGAFFQDKVDELGIMAVPAVFKNGEEFLSGKATIEDILAKLGVEDKAQYDAFTKDTYDMTIVGGGPSGVAAAIYAARKGIKTAIVVEEFGGQVNETLGIENIIGTPYIEGPDLAKALEKHLRDYDIDIIKGQKVAQVSKEAPFTLTLANEVELSSKTVVIATGARWRDVNVPGEQEFKTKGVAYCPHCDAPLFAGKDVAVIGGGNSGIEAAIDLSNIARNVTVLEFMPELKADEILQERAMAKDNITIIKNAQTTQICGHDHVESIKYKDRDTDEIHEVDLDGIFVQIGLMPNTDFIRETVECNRMGEIVVDKNGATSVPGIFAAGDCTDSTYKQIIISMGTGATAALAAFDYLIRHK